MIMNKKNSSPKLFFYDLHDDGLKVQFMVEVRERGLYKLDMLMENKSALVQLRTSYSLGIWTNITEKEIEEIHEALSNSIGVNDFDEKLNLRSWRDQNWRNNFYDLQFKP